MSVDENVLRRALAQQAYASAIERAPDLANHLRIPGSQPVTAATDEAQPLLERAVALDPAFAPAAAALGNALARRGFLVDAMRLYVQATEADATLDDARLATAELAYMRGDVRDAERRFGALFARAQVFVASGTEDGVPRVLVLARPGAWPSNAPIDFVLNDGRVTLHRWYIGNGGPRQRPLPEADCVLVAIGEHRALHAEVVVAKTFLANSGLPYINDPERLAGLARYALRGIVMRVAGVRAAPAARVAAETLREIGDGVREIGGVRFPMLARPVDAHGGRGLARVADGAELRAHVAAVPADAYDLCEFIEYRSADGFYRKYRVVFVDGEPFPYHLAIDRTWLLHAFRTPVAETPWMHAEEARFLTRPETVMPGWPDRMRAIAREIGLDYFGIDCAVDADGEIVVFEADTATLVYRFDSQRFALGEAPVDRIRVALQSLIERRCRPVRTEARAPGVAGYGDG